MMNIQNYVRVKSLEEAFALNQKKQNRIIGGMLWLKMGNGNVGTAIDLCDLGLDTIEETDEQFTIGAMVSLRQIELHEGLNTYTQGAAAAAVRDIVGVQFRNLATVGGSLWGRFGFSDVLTMFLAMDTYVELYQGGVIPLAEFAQMKYDRDILVRVIVKKTPGAFAYQAMRRQSTDFPVLACAVSRVDGVYRAALGARPGRAILLTDEEGILAGGVTAESAKAFAAYAAAHTPTQSNLRGSAEYRTHLVRVLTERALLALEG
ncbi:MAG: FAD binding domain-containing protein [Butyricicoccus sp.]|nr:FAD binding domain-containing protein [Butyricicoccus sp.]